MAIFISTTLILSLIRAVYAKSIDENGWAIGSQEVYDFGFILTFISTFMFLSIGIIFYYINTYFWIVYFIPHFR